MHDITGSLFFGKNAVDWRARRSAEEAYNGDSARGRRILSLVEDLSETRAKPRDVDAEVAEMLRAKAAACECSIERPASVAMCTCRSTEHNRKEQAVHHASCLDGATSGLLGGGTHGTAQAVNMYHTCTVGIQSVRGSWACRLNIWRSVPQGVSAIVERQEST
jgi:hypothetical protein